MKMHYEDALYVAASLQHVHRLYVHVYEYVFAQMIYHGTDTIYVLLLYHIYTYIYIYT